MDFVNFGMIGYGSIAKTHLLGVMDLNIRQNLPFALKCVGVMTRKPTEFKLGFIKNYQDFNEMMRQNRLDFVDICTPNAAHMEYVYLAAEQGRAIYCEKPLAENLKVAQEMTEFVKKASVPTAVALMYRFLPAVNIMKEEVRKNTVGKIIHFRSSMYHSSYLSSKKTGTWRTSVESGGGALMDLGSHLIDLVHYIVGEIKEIDADTRIHFTQRSAVDEYAYCNVKTADGILGSIECSRISAETDNRDTFEIYGETGSLKVNMKHPYVVEHFDAQTGNTVLISATPQLLSKLHFPNERAMLGFHQSAHSATIAAFAESLYKNEKSSVLADFEDGLKVQRVLDMAYSK